MDFLSPVRMSGRKRRASPGVLQRHLQEEGELLARLRKFNFGIYYYELPPRLKRAALRLRRNGALHDFPTTKRATRVHDFLKEAVQ